MMLYLLDDTPPDLPFPDPNEAEKEPNGLCAVGGDLSASRLLEAYKSGIFPWFGEDQPILWWSPDPRMVLFPEELRVSRSLRKALRQGRFELSFDRAFADVIRACAGPRQHEDSTWLLPEMIAAYSELHRLGMAHSVEAWQDGELVGGLYGVCLGNAFFGESMFHRVRDASKAALAYLAEQCRHAGFAFIDCQVYTEHLDSLGAREIPRAQFLAQLHDALQQPGNLDWQATPLSSTALEAAR